MEADQSEHPYKQFGRHYEYMFEAPSEPAQTPRFRFSYGTVDSNSGTPGVAVRRTERTKGNESKKHWLSNSGKARLTSAQPEHLQFQNECFVHFEFIRRSRNLKNDYGTNRLLSVKNEHATSAWKEREGARRRVQAEYEIVRQLADDIFGQAEKQMSAFPTFDIPRFQQIFSMVTAASSPLPKNSWSRAERQHGKILKDRKRKLKDNDREMVKNHENKLEDAVGESTEDGPLKQKQSGYDASYRIFGILPKFDPRFPFDRAYKLMEGLQSPKLFKFPPINSFI
uniref:Uncharacterized protein n=1 Tax=Setaria digitata TaxID=48799 RepID=A0A915PN46_9BILA